MNPLFSVMQRVSLHYYVIITYYYVIITPGSLITRYHLFQTFQSPELADAIEQDASPFAWQQPPEGVLGLGIQTAKKSDSNCFGPATCQKSEISLDTRNKGSSEWKHQIYRMWKVKTGVHRQTA